MSTATPPAASLDSLIAQLQETGLIAPEQLAPFIPPAANPTDAQAWTNQLVACGLLTRFQASQVATGKTKSLLIGAYVMLDRVSGGGGLLFKAMHRRMQRTVFVKPLPPSLMKTASARVQRDVAAAGRLAHPNLVALQDLDEVGGAHFLVTEFVDGADFATVAQQGKLAIDKACGLVAQAADVLAYLHSQGAVHRDVKIDNLFIERGGVVKLFGLGIAPADTGDAAGDVAGLGRVLYRLVGGAELPVGAIPALKAARPEVSPALEKFVLRMLSPTLAERPTAAEVAAALRTPELTKPVPPPDAASAMFPELFVNAEEEASTVMQAPFEAGVLPPLNAPAAPAAATPVVAPAAAVANMPEPISPAPLAAAPPAAMPPAPTSAPPVEISVPQPAATGLFGGPPITLAPSIPNEPAPLPDVPAEPASATPPVAEFTFQAPPSFAVEAAAGPEIAVGIAPAADGFVAAATTSAATAASKPKKTKRTQPIELPFNLQLDPKYLEPKYLLGAAGGSLVLIAVLIWALVRDTKSTSVKAVPAIPVSKAPRPAAASITPGMFNLPKTDAKNQPGVQFDEFGFQVQPGAAPAKPAGSKKK
jgi:hypothetical protein